MKKTNFITIFLLLICSSIALAQSARLKRANEAMRDLDYITAIVEYQQVLQNVDDTEAKVNLAECYLKINDTENAEYWYSQIVSLPNVKPINKLYYGMMLQRNGKCDVAREWFQQFVELATQAERTDRVSVLVRRGNWVNFLLIRPR